MELLYKEDSYKIRGAAFKVYKALGCGHKESVYQKAFGQALTSQGLRVEREKCLPVIFEGKKVGIYVPDFLVEEKIIIESKAKQMVITQDIKQFWQYLTGTEYELGFLINFGNPGGVEIMRRVYNTSRNKLSA